MRQEGCSLSQWDDEGHEPHFRGMCPIYFGETHPCSPSCLEKKKTFVRNQNILVKISSS